MHTEQLGNIYEVHLLVPPMSQLIVWPAKNNQRAILPGWIVWHSSRQINYLSFQESPDKSQISYFLLCNNIDLFIPVAILESDRLFNHA